jgi:small subunit ribosomal protein S7
MARRRRAVRRAVAADSKYNSELVSKVTSYLMVKGKKSTAEQIVYGALDEMKEQMGQDPLEILTRAVDNVKPKVEVRSRRVGGATYQVPVEVNRDRQLALALRWIIQLCRTRKGLPMKRALAMELMEASKNQGNAVKKRDDTHRMAQANKAFAHYAW